MNIISLHCHFAFWSGSVQHKTASGLAINMNTATTVIPDPNKIYTRLFPLERID
jgi:hypothetical protein